MCGVWQSYAIARTGGVLGNVEMKGSTMKRHDITATCDPKGLNRTIVVPFDLPETVQEAVKVWGEDVVLSMAVRAAVIQLQASLRAQLGLIGDKRKDDNAIRKDHADFKPEVGAEKVSPTEKIVRLTQKLTPEQRKALLAELTKK